MTCASPLVHDQLKNSQIRIEGLRFAYEQSVVFDNFNLDTQSKLILLEGPSGCGKTTLLKLLAGILSPSSVTSFIRPERARIILQEDSLFPWLTVEGNLACLPDWKGIQHCPPAVCSLVPLIESLVKRRAYTLSFGQRRIVELFRILYSPAQLMCLDEPFNFLDSSKRIAVTAVIENLIAEGVCFVISSHYRADFLRWESGIYRFDGSLPVNRLEIISKP